MSEIIIYIHCENGWIHISDNQGNYVRYLFYTKREALRQFKNDFGYRYKRGITIVEDGAEGKEK